MRLLRRRVQRRRRYSAIQRYKRARQVPGGFWRPLIPESKDDVISVRQGPNLAHKRALGRHPRLFRRRV